MLFLMLGIGCAEECTITGDSSALALCWTEGPAAMLQIEDFDPGEDGGALYWRVEDPACEDTIKSPVTVGVTPGTAEETSPVVLPFEAGEYLLTRYEAGSGGLSIECGFDSSLELVHAGSSSFTVYDDSSVCAGGGC